MTASMNSAKNTLRVCHGSYVMPLLYAFLEYDEYNYIILASKLNYIQKINVHFLLFLSKNNVSSSSMTSLVSTARI